MGLITTQLGRLLGVVIALPAAAQPLAVWHRSTVGLPAVTAIDQHGASFSIAGLSGITRQSGDDYLAAMDNSNRLLRLRISLQPNGAIAGVTVIGGITLEQARDFEGVAFMPAPEPGGPGSVLLAEEGTPAVHEFALVNGSLIRTLPTPGLFAARRDNLGFESLTRRGLTGEVWTANEEALTPDGPVSSTSVGSTVRLLRFADAGTGLAPAQQFPMITGQLHGSPISGSRSGLVDLIVLPNGKLLALERSLAFSLAGLFQTRIYELSTETATEVTALAALAGAAYTPVAKRLLYLGGLNNLEGLCLGPRLPNGRYAMIGVVDDGDPVSVNAVVSFELGGGVGCTAEFNGDDVVSVQDIFDFLAAYFSLSPWADVNASGDLTVQDMFDFLAAFFLGCR